MIENKYTIMPLKDNPGIFYEDVGEVRTSEITWKMVIYVDLADVINASKRIQQELNIATKRCDDVPHVCKSQPQFIMLHNKLDKMMKYQDHIRRIINHPRVRRVPLEFIGEISKILFGTLTIEDAKSLENIIINVENKTQDLAALLINHTIATRARFGELSDATLKIQRQLLTLQQEIQEKFNNLTDDIIQKDIHGYFSNVVEEIDRAILEHEIDLNILIDGILFGKQGIIHPRIISPQYLVENSRRIKERIPHAEFPVPINEEDTDQLVKISDLHIAYLNNRLIYILQIPLLTPGKYKLYKAIPLPAKQDFSNNKYAIINPNTEYIALNEDADSYYEFQSDELNICIKNNPTFICPSIFPLKRVRQTINCNIEVLINRNIEPNHCKITIKELRDTYWKILHTPGNWLYTATGKETINIECPNFSKHIEIENSGIITVHQGCKIKARTVTMSYPSIQTTKLIKYFVLTNNLSISHLYEPVHERYKINITDTMHEIWTNNQSNIEATFDDIIEKAREIKVRKNRDQKITLHNVATCIVIILGMLLTIMLVLYHRLWVCDSSNPLSQACSCTNNQEQRRRPNDVSIPTIEIARSFPQYDQSERNLQTERNIEDLITARREN